MLIRAKAIRFLLLLLFLSVGCGRDGGETVLVSAGNELIRYTGRFDRTDPSGPRFSWPGSSIRARFTGASLDLIFSDSASGGPHPVAGRKSNYLEIIIDDLESVTLELKPGNTVYHLADSLGEGDHTVTIFKRTGADLGAIRFRGIRLAPGGVLKALPPRPDLRLEFIGDSITCGYGNEAGGPEEGYSPRTENNYLSYGALTARALGAEYRCLAAAGRGVNQNYDGSTSGTIPELYIRVLPGDPSRRWDFKEPPPRVVIINLGTNDFSRRIPDKSAFLGSYRKLIATVRKNYPDADIFCVVGPMLNDKWPKGAQALTTIRSYLNEMIVGLKGEGDEKVYYLEFEPQKQSEGIGAGWHPGLKIHQRMADKLTEAISGILSD